MGRFERSKGREYRGRRDRFPRGESGGRSDRPQRRESGGGYEEYSIKKREFGGRRGFGRERRPLEMTRVICSACKAECEVPFRPDPSKPVYCRECFSKDNDRGRRPRDNGRQNSEPTRDFDIINEKLNKIMKALDID